MSGQAVEYRVGDDTYVERVRGVIAARKWLRDWYTSGDWQIWEEHIYETQGIEVSICGIARKALRGISMTGSPLEFAGRVERLIAGCLRDAGVKDVRPGGVNWPELRVYGPDDVVVGWPAADKGRA